MLIMNSLFITKRWSWIFVFGISFAIVSCDQNTDDNDWLLKGFIYSYPGVVIVPSMVVKNESGVSQDYGFYMVSDCSEDGRGLSQEMGTAAPGNSVGPKSFDSLNVPYPGVRRPVGFWFRVNSTCNFSPTVTVDVDYEGRNPNYICIVQDDAGTDFTCNKRPR
ncbi:hypothetical protein CH371_05605 [Leptospira wolffii]|uniref:Uncharacterized protein n=2 Tax=Leptospira wolffii TaxID=409998 RepID=A0A2M9ZGL7_9LEPT|nr:hypothetical protein CH371_05605 [Leptospira wolffii]